MGATALKEPGPMVAERPIDGSGVALDAADIAAKAVAEIPQKAQELGATETQAAALAEAMRLIIAGEGEAAARPLLDAGYPSVAVDDLVSQLRMRLRIAA